MLTLEFSGKASLWPRFNLESFEKSISKLPMSNGNMILREVSEDEIKFNTPSQESGSYTSSPINFAFGKFKGGLYSIRIVERAFRDNLRYTTNLGNVWTIITYSMTLFFFVSLITFSGGAKPDLDIQAIIELFGIWLIFELAFVRGIFSSFKYGQLESRLGINLKLVIIGMFSTVWMEFISLLLLLNVWSLMKFSRLTSIDSCIGLFLCLLSLLLLGFPYSYFISHISRDRIDMRFIVPITFRFIVFSTPLFSTFHQNFTFTKQVLAFSPLNFSFDYLQTLKAGNLLNFITFSAFMLVSYCLLFLKPNLQSRSIWIRIK